MVWRDFPEVTGKTECRETERQGLKGTWMNLVNILLSGSIQTQKVIYCTIAFM